jgi:hypothetical protein
MRPEQQEHRAGVEIGRHLRRLATSETNRRHLAELPLFQVEQDMPRKLEFLLERLDATGEAPSRS